MKTSLVSGFLFALVADASEERLRGSGKSDITLGSQLLCPTAPGSVTMHAGDWCVMNCSTALSFDIDFGKGQYAPNAGNVEYVDEQNFNDFLRGYPFFHYQTGSQIGVNVASATNQLLSGPLVIIQCANVAHGAQPATSCGPVKFNSFKCVASCGGTPCDPSAGTCCRDNQCYGNCVGGTCCEVATTGAVVGCCTHGGDCCGSIQVPTCCGPGAQCCRAGAAMNACCNPGSYCCTTSPTGCCVGEDSDSSEKFPSAVSGYLRLMPSNAPAFMTVAIQ